MAFLHTPYIKPDDVELERSVEAGESCDRMNSIEHASIAETHSDRDKVNDPQAQPWSEVMTQRVTNITTGFCPGDTFWSVGIIRLCDIARTVDASWTRAMV